MTEPNEKTSTFLVTHADDASVVVKDVHDGQVHPLSTNPGVDVGDAIEATLAPDQPLDLTWQIVDVERRRSLSVDRSDEPPTSQERELAAVQDVGELTRTERAGTGEIHVLTVPPEETEAVVSDVFDDEGTLARAARIEGVERVEIRAADGIVSIRYLP